MNLICSAPSEQRLAVLLNRYWFSENWTIQDGQAYNKVTKVYKGRVEHKKGRYKFYL